MTTSSDDFEAAKTVADRLKGMEKERQERIRLPLLASGGHPPEPLPVIADRHPCAASRPTPPCAFRLDLLDEAPALAL